MAHRPMTAEQLREVEAWIAARSGPEGVEKGWEVPLEWLDRAAKEVRWLRSNVRGLLRMIAGEAVPCRFCQAEIWFVPKRGGGTAPYTALGLNHFADCPGADEARKAKAARSE